jgi:hypothetical protein
MVFVKNVTRFEHLMVDSEMHKFSCFCTFTLTEEKVNYNCLIKPALGGPGMFGDAPMPAAGVGPLVRDWVLIVPPETPALVGTDCPGNCPVTDAELLALVVAIST